MLPITLYGAFARLLNAFIPVKKKTWVFGADYGKSYREGSKYLLEYMLKNHPDYDCCFLTWSTQVYDDLCSKGIPVEMNYSLKGIFKAAKAECIFTTQTIADIHFTYKKHNRRFYYLVHGQPLKIAQSALKDTAYWKKYHKKESVLVRIKEWLTHFFNDGYSMNDVEFVAATSDFLKPYMEKDFGNIPPVKVMGMPRNDALFQPERMGKEKWVKGLKGKFVITYMPTHRAYGKGQASPTPFKDRADIQEWMRENGVVLLVKNHPNMIKQCKTFYSSDCIIDITTLGIDPQVAIYHSDVLVTDFSSVWMDYLLLRRPVLFYIYDDFEHNDVGCHYDIRKNPPGHFCYSEDEFFELIKKTKIDYDAMKPSDDIVGMYHKYVDGKACERYFNLIANGTM